MFVIYCLSVVCSIAIEDIFQIPLQLADADFIALRSIQQVDNDDNNDDDIDDAGDDDASDDDDLYEILLLMMMLLMLLMITYI